LKIAIHDVFGGVTAAVVALPLALAFGVASGAGALAGLYGAILVGFFAALLGGTPSQISGPTGPMTVVMTVIVAHFSGSPSTAFLVVLLGGVIQIAFGLCGIGRFIRLVPYPVVSGFMSGIGCIIIILQIPAFLGHSAVSDGLWPTLLAAPSMFSSANIGAVLVGILTLSIVYLTPRPIGRYCPPPLLALVAATVVAYNFYPGIDIIGAIPTGLPSILSPVVNVDDIFFIVRYALILAVLGSIDSLLTSLVADEMTATEHNSNKELIGQGVGNIFAGLLGGLPGAGATMRTVTNIRAGGKGPMSGIVHSMILLALVLGFGSLAEHVPLAVLAGILFTVGINIIDWKYLKIAHSAPRSGLLIMATTLTTTVFVDLISAVALGVVMASVLFVARMSKVQGAGLTLTHDVQDLDGIFLRDASKNKITITLFVAEGPLSFGVAKDISRILRGVLTPDVLVVDLTKVTTIDTSATLSIESAIAGLDVSKTRIMFCGLSPGVNAVFTKLKFFERITVDVTRTYAELTEAINSR